MPWIGGAAVVGLGVVQFGHALEGGWLLFWTWNVTDQSHIQNRYSQKEIGPQWLMFLQYKLNCFLSLFDKTGTGSHAHVQFPTEHQPQCHEPGRKTIPMVQG